MTLLIPTTIMNRMGCVNVTDAAYGAIGDGVTDDTTAIQSAIQAALTTGSRYSAIKFIYFPPNKTYLISDTLKGQITGVTAPDYGWRAGFVFFGIDRATTIIKLAASASGFNTTTIKPMLISGSEDDPDDGGNPTGNGNRAFRNGVYNLSFDLNGNTGASAIDYLTSNRGGIENVQITNSVTSGRGINCTRGTLGPALISNVRIDGCDRGIFVKGYSYSLALSNVVVSGQGTSGVETENGNLAIENLQSFNNVPAVRSTGAYSFISIQNSNFQLGANQTRSSTVSGINSAGRVEVMNVASSAYDTVITNKTTTVAESDLTTVDDVPTVERFTTLADKTLFAPAIGTVRLDAKDAPDGWSSAASDWAVVDDYTGATDRIKLQASIDSGKAFVALPVKSYEIDDDLYIRGSLKKLIGFQSALVAKSGTSPTIYFEGSTNSFTTLEHLRISGCKFVHRSSKALHLKHLDLGNGYENTNKGVGDLFFSDCGVSKTRIRFRQKCWARQLNIEYQSVMLDIADSFFWGIGYKTESSSSTGQVNVRAARSSVQISGATFYALGSGQNQTTPKTPSIELDDNQSVLLSWNCFDVGSNNTKNYDIQVRERFDGATKELLKTELGNTAPTCTGYYGGTPHMQKLFSAYTPYDKGRLAANNTFAMITAASFVAGYNPNGFALVAASGEVTIAGSDLGGYYQVDILAGFSSRIVSGSTLALVAQAGTVVYSSLPLGRLITVGRDSSAKASAGTSGFGEFLIPAGTTSFTFTPKFYASTAPANRTLSVDEIAYSISHIGSIY